MSRFFKAIINLAITAVVGFVFFYFALPAINFQAKEFYSFAIILCIIFLILSVVNGGKTVVIDRGNGIKTWFLELWRKCRIPTLLVLILIAVYAVGAVLSAEFFRARAYRDLITINQGDFAEDVMQISFDKIPYLDKNSAQRLGDRKLGELSDMVSQFEVADDYAQINYNDRPVRVTPLEYGDVIKWIANRKNGIPAYVIIDMASSAVEVKRPKTPIRYSRSEYFNRNIIRHIRLNYPTYMFEDPVFELDEDGIPYWICPKVEMKIGLFGGKDINGAVLVNALTGENKYYEEVPTWVDRVYSADLIVRQYDYHGAYQNGFLNSLFGQKDVTVTTSGYNYIALNDDVYMYTGITSVGGDQSNIGFILSNQRTKETKFYPGAGAAETSAMSSAEGVVQHLGYKATFPLLLNVSDQPTYFVSLKDNAQLVKMYALVNVQQYQIVATGSTVAQCLSEYIRLLAEHNVTVAETPPESSVVGVISEIRSAVIEGTTFYYIRLDGHEEYYSISAESFEEAVVLNAGDSVVINAEEEAAGKIRKAYSVLIK